MSQKEEYENRLDEDEKAIRNFVMRNPGRTKNEIATAMHEEGECSRITTLKKIENLISRQILEDRRAKRNNFSCIHFSDRDKFAIMNVKIQEANKKINSLNQSKDASHSRVDAASWLLIMLLAEITKIQDFSEADVKILTTRILNSLLKVALLKIKLMKTEGTWPAIPNKTKI